MVTQTNSIIRIPAHAPLDSDEFGHKTANLTHFASLGKWVLPGIAISVSLGQTGGWQSEFPVESDLSDPAYLYGLRLPLIVRSSSTHDGTGSILAGAFPTVGQISSRSDLLRAVQRCFDARLPSRAQLWGRPPQGDPHMSVLIQEQKAFVESALVFIGMESSVVEFYGCDLVGGAQGRVRPNVVQSLKDLQSSSLTPFKSEIIRLSQFVHDTVLSAGRREDILLEIGHDGEKPWLLQLNLLAANHLRSDNCLEPNGQVTKLAAMSYFRDRGLTPDPTLIYESGFDPRDAAAQILKEVNGSPAITLRAARGSEIGLPRHFIRGAAFKNVAGLLSDWSDCGYGVIAYPYIDVRRSFELAIEGDSILLEHVPGMWESENGLEPDVLYLQGENCFALLNDEPRKARIGLGAEVLTSLPVTHDEAGSWASRVLREVPLLRRRFEGNEPLIIHFVEDSLGRWYFLNVRPSRRLCIDSPVRWLNENSVKFESSAEPRSVRLDLRCKRGSESAITERLSSLGSPKDLTVYVDFGLLSHPAMALRELGYLVMPSYSHPCFDGLGTSRKRWTRIEWSIDVGLEPIHRIFQEPAVEVLTNVRIVRDRDPMTEGHLLVLANFPIRSFADLQAGLTLVNLVENQLPRIVGSDFWLFERGRASFCTSGLTEEYAHAHILPSDTSLDVRAGKLLEHLAMSEPMPLRRALEIASLSNQEYLLAHRSGGGSFLCTFGREGIRDKRLLRTFLSEG